MSKERPILFSGEMVRAILDGRKTQTRRVIKPQPTGSKYWTEFEGAFYPSNFKAIPEMMRCPYGVPGDLLWVRETWIPTTKGERVADYRATSEGREYATPWKPSIHMPRWASRITLRVVNVRVERVQEISFDDAYAEGIATDIWDQAAVARNYAKKDAWFQMWSSELPDYVDLDDLYQASFRSLWDSINAARGYSWDANPWVWVVEFERVTP